MNTTPPKTIRQAVSELAWLKHDFAHLRTRDPALRGKPLAALEALTYPGLWAIAAHRVAHVLHVAGWPVIPGAVSQLTRFLTGVEIHPGARIGRGLFIDHGSGVVIGETAEIGDHVLIFHQVSLGNSHVDSRGKRHPTIGSDVVLGAGAKVLGPILVGSHSVVGAGAVVTHNVPPRSVLVSPAARMLEPRPPPTTVEAVPAAAPGATPRSAAQRAGSPARHGLPQPVACC